MPIGVLEVPLGDLVKNRGGRLSDKSVMLFALAASPTGAPDGATNGLGPAPSKTNRAEFFSTAQAGSRGFRMTSVATLVAAGDYKNEMGLDGPPDPNVQILQGGRVVYWSPTAQDTPNPKFLPEAVFLFVQAQEQLLVRVFDADATGNDLCFEVRVPASALQAGVFRFHTPKGSKLELKFEARNTL